MSKKILNLIETEYKKIDDKLYGKSFTIFSAAYRSYLLGKLKMLEQLKKKIKNL